MKASEKLLEKYKSMTEGNQNSGKGSEDFLKLPEGETRIRILPAANENLPFYAENIQHGIKIEGKYKSFTCRKVIGEDCPMDDFVSELWGQHNAACKANGWVSKETKTPYSEMAKELRGKERYYLNVVARADESKVMILNASKTLFEKVLHTMLLQEEGEMVYGDISDLKTGRDFIVVSKKKPKASYVTYDESRPSPKVSAAGKPDQIQLWTESLHDLQALVVPSSVEELNTVIAKLREQVEKEFDEFRSKPSTGLASKMTA